MDGKRWVLALCLVIVVAVAVLSSSLHDVHFQPGRSIAVETATEPATPLAVTEMVSKPPLWKVLLFWLAFVINLILFFYLLPASCVSVSCARQLALHWDLWRY